MVVLMQRRQFLQYGVCAAGLPLFAQNRAAAVSEADRGTIKLCHRINARTVTDDDLRFLQQIGLRWVRLEFDEGDVHLDALRSAQQRFAQFDMRIYSGVHYSYRSTKIQLGQPGRDRDIETYAQFLRDLGSIGIPVASYDFTRRIPIRRIWYSGGATQRGSS